MLRVFGRGAVFLTTTRSKSWVEWRAIGEPMRSVIAIFLLVILAVAQLPGKPQPQPKRAPILGFEENKNATPIMDTDIFDEQKYLEESGADSSSAKTKRAAHETLLTREFMDAFNQEKSCDGVTLQGK